MRFMSSLLAHQHLIWPLSSYNKEEYILKEKKDQGAMGSPEGLKEQVWMTTCWNPSGPPPAGKAKKKTGSSPGVTKFILSLQQNKRVTFYPRFQLCLPSPPQEGDWGHRLYHTHKSYCLVTSVWVWKHNKTTLLGAHCKARCGLFIALLSLVLGKKQL